MWTIQQIKDLCEEYCNKCGIIFNSPIVINGKLTRTLGRCICIYQNSKVTPIRIEISRQLLETSTDECIKDVIAHECAHYITAAITHENHGHDITFKYYCAKIGTSNDGKCFENLQRTKPYEEIYKYTIYCSECGQMIAGRSRASAITKYPENYQSNCCHAKLIVKQNW